MEYHSKYTGAEVDALLGKVESGEVGGKVTVDSALSTESENPVMNKVIAEELNKKVEGYNAVLASVDLTGKYVNTVPLGIAITDGMEIYIHYREWYGLKKFVLNKANDFYHEEWNETGDYLLQAKYEDGVLTLDEPNNGALDLFELVEVFDSKAIDDSLIPDTISRTADVEDAMGNIEESVEELRDETTALWENLDHGVFPDLVSGDLAGRGESVPASFGFRASGGKSIKDGRAYIKRIKGNSVVWNQRLQWRGNGNVYKGLTVTYEGGEVHIQGAPEDTEIVFYSLFWDEAGDVRKFTKNHYYLIRGASEHFELNVYSNVSVFGGNCITQKIGDTMRLNLRGYDLTIGQEINESFSAQVIDLTQMFGAGNEPMTIEEFYARVATLGVDLNVYNEGEVIHCNTESIKSVGDNAWDEEWRTGLYASSTGEYVYRTKNICNANTFRILPNEEYWVNVNTEAYLFCYDEDMQFIKYLYAYKPSKILTPANAAYMNFYCSDAYGNTYKNDIMITLVHSGWKQDTDAGYQPYWQDTLPLPIISKYFPQGMKKAGSAHDEIRYNKASGKWEAVQRIGSVDMGSLQWSYHANYGFYATAPNNMVEGNLNYLTNLSYSKYANPDRISWGNGDKAITNGLPTIGTSWVRNICVKDSAYTDVASFTAAMQGVILYYELAEPIVTELDAEDQNFRDYYNVADFGTEQSQSSVPSAAFSADIIYQFNAVDMIREHEIEINELQSIIATMQAQLASLTSNNG